MSLHFLSVPVLIMVGATLYAALHYQQLYLRARERRAHLHFAWLCAAVALYGAFSALLYSSASY